MSVTARTLRAVADLVEWLEQRDQLYPTPSPVRDEQALHRKETAEAPRVVPKKVG